MIYFETILILILIGVCILGLLDPSWLDFTGAVGGVCLLIFMVIHDPTEGEK